LFELLLFRVMEGQLRAYAMKFAYFSGLHIRSIYEMLGALGDLTLTSWDLLRAFQSGLTRVPFEGLEPPLLSPPPPVRTRAHPPDPFGPLLRTPPPPPADKDAAYVAIFRTII
jgi:hypothetical protein